MGDIMKDYLVKSLAFDNQVRIYACQTTNLVSEAQQRHDLYKTAAAALGRTMTAGAMMGSMLKGKERIAISIEGGGPIGKVIVNSNAYGEVSGTVSNPHVDIELNEHGKLDVRGAVGTEGFLKVTKDLGLKDLFTGSVPIVSGEIAEDFTYYFAASEQTPSAVSVGVLVNPDDNNVLSSGGFIIQMMPGATDETIDYLEKKISNFPHISRFLAIENSPEDIIKELCGEHEYEILETKDLKFNCDCSKERFRNGLVTLGTEDIETLIEEDNGAETICHFCNEKYYFTKEELEEIVSEGE